MMRLLRRWAFGPPLPPARLSPDEALTIGRAALAAGHAWHPLDEPTVERHADGHWHIRTPTVGSGASAIIDDATGEVLHAARWGLR